MNNIKYVINFDNITIKIQLLSTYYHLLWPDFILQINELINPRTTHSLYFLCEKQQLTR